MPASPAKSPDSSKTFAVQLHIDACRPDGENEARVTMIGTRHVLLMRITLASPTKTGSSMVTWSLRTHPCAICFG